LIEIKQLTDCRLSSHRVSNFIESSFESSFELVEFILDEIFVTKFTD